ncbi:hypothetical protein [Rufibacter roseus]|uniref:hypothetical protein n=1 Tax=Rufibacter roseus TaxID=1567108 RepID=UPI0036734F3F
MSTAGYFFGNIGVVKTGSTADIGHEHDLCGSALLVQRQKIARKGRYQLKAWLMI